jgi:hypothetical protein
MNGWRVTCYFIDRSLSIKTGFKRILRWNEIFLLHLSLYFINTFKKGKALNWIVDELYAILIDKSLSIKIGINRNQRWNEIMLFDFLISINIRIWYMVSFNLYNTRLWFYSIESPINLIRFNCSLKRNEIFLLHFSLYFINTINKSLATELYNEWLSSYMLFYWSKPIN